LTFSEDEFLINSLTNPHSNCTDSNYPLDCSFTDLPPMASR
jgi:hypothetical protein